MEKGKMKPVSQRPEWKELQDHCAHVRELHLRGLFDEDSERGSRLAFEVAGLYFDYSKNLITDKTIRLLLSLAEACKLQESIVAMFRGDPINTTEQLPALHVALRATDDEIIEVDSRNVVKEVHHRLEQMANAANQIRRGEWRGYSGKEIRNVINIGIGGSDLGPVMAYEALRPYTRRDMVFGFVSNVDGADFYESTLDLDPAATLFIVSSKSFDTPETMANAQAARKWIIDALHDEEAVANHFVAVSNHRGRVVDFGIEPGRRFDLWDWVGGRFSIDSAIGLSLMMAIGPKRFRSMLSGFRAIDDHFCNAPFERNAPVLMGLLSVWYSSFFNAETAAVVPYSHYLGRFPAYLQQLMMESLGKRVRIDGTPVDYPTGAISWGEPGTNSQHSFFQLIHQGTHLIPCDFIAFREAQEPLQRQHDMLVANAFAQAEALAFGKTAEQVRAEDIPERLVPHRTFPGNRPSTMILADRLDPETLGKLVALYEHAVYTQSVIWGINAFDQWGVELGKALAGRILPELQSEQEPDLEHHDTSTRALIKRYRDKRFAR